MVIQEQEESGWTSYLGCPSSSQQLPAPPHSSLTPQHPHLSSTTLFTLDNFQRLPHTTLNSHFLAAHLQHHHHHHHHHHHEQATEHDGYCIGRAPSMDFPDDESCGSSTLSDANSSLGCSRPQQKHRFATRNQQSLKRKRRQCSDGKVAATPGGLLEDTATSLPYSDQASKCSRLDISDDCNEEEDVSKRFKALQALIPCLKEMMDKENEEEMLNAIISHVRALEKKVQLLSDVWRLSQVNHE